MTSAIAGATAWRRRRTIRMVAPGLLLMYAAPMLVVSGWPWTAGCVFTTGLLLMERWASYAPAEVIARVQQGRLQRAVAAAEVAGWRRRDGRMLVPSVLLSFAALILLIVEWYLPGVLMLSVGAALVSAWALREFLAIRDMSRQSPTAP